MIFAWSVLRPLPDLFLIPGWFLAALLLLTAGAVMVQAVARRRRSGGLRRLAGPWGMHYAYPDRLGLARRLAGVIPVIGASDIRVLDLLFCIEGHRHRYIFTIRYGVGVLSGNRRRQCAAGFTEAVRRGNASAPEACQLIVAPVGHSLLDQYRAVHDALDGSVGTVANARAE